VYSVSHGREGPVDRIDVDFEEALARAVAALS
jgi:hypothetical protein